MEEHVHEELVVVEADAVCDPGAVMVHLQDAAVALRAVMAPVGLGFVAPLAYTDATVAFTLDRGLHSHERLFIRLASARLLVRLSGGGDQRSLSRLQIL